MHILRHENEKEIAKTVALVSASLVTMMSDPRAAATAVQASLGEYLECARPWEHVERPKVRSRSEQITDIVELYKHFVKQGLIVEDR